MATVKLRGKSWVLNWFDAEGQHRMTLGEITERQAKIILRAKEAELVTGVQLLSGSRKFIQFDQLAKEYKTWHEQTYPATYPVLRYTVNTKLLPYFEHFALDQISNRLVEQYKFVRTPLAMASTVAKEITTLKAMMNKAIEWKYIDKHDLKYVVMPKVLDSKPVQYFTKEQLAQLYATKHGAIWKLMANTGIRRKEMLQLKWEHIDEKTLKVVSSEEARTKSGKWRGIPMNESAREALAVLKNDTEYVVPRRTGPAMTELFRAALKEVGIPGHLHMLRHSFISHLTMKGVPLRTIQVLAGHATIAMTEKYSHLAPGHMEDHMKGFEL